MIITIPVGQGQVAFSDKISSTGGNVRFISHKDVLEAFSRCQFQSVKQLNSWLLRLRDAHKGVSRRAVTTQMLKERQAV